MATRIAINGFGRIGKNLLRIIKENSLDFEVVAINSTSGPEAHAHLLKYDSIYGIFPGQVEVTKSSIIIDGREIPFTAEADPANLPWKQLDVDVVFESTGKLKKRADNEKHLLAGASKVIITAPADEAADATIVVGVNHDVYDAQKHDIISAASCTTNCLAPVVHVLNKNFGVQNGSLTTVHAYTADQRLVDKPHKDLRRARSAGLSIIPTSTGAAKAIGSIIPELKGKLNGFAFRVPTPTVSIVDFVANLNKSVTSEEVNDALKSASKGELKGVLGFTMEPLVSVDFSKNPMSSIVDGLSTMVIDGTVVKVLSWYDNEYGYSCRVLDLAKYITGDRDFLNSISNKWVAGV
jgi:glyceraldehyde 3-phosphate dehydrogenase